MEELHLLKTYHALLADSEHYETHEEEIGAEHAL